MNNDQFRRLAFGSGASSGAKKDGGSHSPAGAPAALGSRQKSSIPMTPRTGSNVNRVAFARQMAERFQDAEKQKRFRTSTPKGSRLATGFVDRAKIRTEQETKDALAADADDRATRLAALEDMYKKDEIDRATYEKLQLEIAGGDLSSTHLVKGLDFKLLNRVRNGEDVYGGRGGSDGDGDGDGDVDGDGDGDVNVNDNETATATAPDFDDEFERLEESQVRAVEKEKTKKKGQYSTTAAVAGQKRTRDQILAEMKAAREAAKQKAAAAPALGSHFKKIGATQQAAGSRIERDSRGREVLVIVDEDGHEKRKVRKTRTAPAAAADDESAVVDASKADKVLGMEVPEFYRKKQEAEAAAAAAKEVDIFDDVGSDYNPLAGMDSDSSDSEAESDKETKKTKKETKQETKEDRDSAQRRSRSASSSDREDGETSDGSAESRRPRRRSPTRQQGDLSATAPPAAAAAPQRKSYFAGSKLLSEETSRGGPSLDDPAVLAALRKAKQMRHATESEDKTKEAEREERLKKLMQSTDRDAEDLDMGFGSSRMQDEEDMDEDGGERIKLSTWRGKNGGGSDGEDDDGEAARGDKAKRKRGGKKRKGDGNNIADVMRVLDQRREKKGS